MWVQNSLGLKTNLDPQSFFSKDFCNPEILVKKIDKFNHLILDSSFSPVKTKQKLLLGTDSVYSLLLVSILTCSNISEIYHLIIFKGAATLASKSEEI